MNGYFLTGIIACAVGMAIGAGGMHYTIDLAQLDAAKLSLSSEQTAHATDNARNALKLKAVSDKAAKDEADAITAGRASAGRIASLDQALQQERLAHVHDNEANNTAIATGARRLRVAVTACTTANGVVTAGSDASASSLGNGAGGWADLSPTTGLTLFRIADSADADARAKADYLQGFVRSGQQQGLIAGPDDK